jgi:hypothetical protein
MEGAKVFPLCWAHLAWVGGGVLSSRQLAQCFRHVTGDFVGMDFHRFDHAFWVDHERAAQSQAVFFNVHAESASQLVCRVADQWELGFAHSRRSLVPHFVREVGVGGDDVHLSAGFLERSVVVSCVFDFGGAVEGESGWHEDEHVPLALERGFGHFDELAVVESLVFERLNLCVDQRHVDSFGLLKTIE